MKNPVFTGAGVAIITPMYEDGSINFDELGRIIEDQIARSTDAIVICGTTGECSTMTDEEQLATIKYTVDVVNHRVPVIAGAGSNDTDHGCALAAKSAACGADALLMVTPYYNKTSQAGLKGNFIVQKTGQHPMRTRLRLFLEWGITFEEPYIVPERADRAVAYANREDLERNLPQSNKAENADMRGAYAVSGRGGIAHEPAVDKPRRRGGKQMKTYGEEDL